MPPQPPLRKVVLSKQASAKWNALPAGISREVRIAAQSTMHSAPAAYSKFRATRVPEREDFACRYQFVIADAQEACSHLFTIDFDDAQSPDALFVLDVTYTRFDAD